MFEADDYRLVLPEIVGAEYIVNHWQRCGMYENGMSGSIPLTWKELQAYSIQSQSYLDAWESGQVMQMSRAYVSFSRGADELNCAAPYSPELTHEQLAKIKLDTSKQAMSILRKKPD